MEVERSCGGEKDRDVALVSLQQALALASGLRGNYRAQRRLRYSELELELERPLSPFIALR